MRARPAILSALVLALACPTVLYATEPEPAAGPTELVGGVPAVPAAPSVAPAPAEPPRLTAAGVVRPSVPLEPDARQAQSSPASSVEVTARAAADGSVAMNDFSFSPASVSIQAGDSVTWVNRGNTPHTATGDGFDTGTVRPGRSETATFSRAGTFSYVCSLHSNMRGTVRVASAGGQADEGGAPAAEGGDASAGSATSTGSSTGTSTATAPPATAPTLPASGRDVFPFGLLGLALLALGVHLRWRTARP